MKFTILLLAVLAVNSSYALRTLNDDLIEFIRLLPQQEVLKLFSEYSASDPEFQKLLAFQGSEDYKKYFLDTEHVAEFTDLIIFMQNSGLDIYSYLRVAHELLGLPEFIPPTYSISRKTGVGMKGFIKDVDAVVPWNKIQTFSALKRETSPEYNNFYNVLNSQRFKELFCNFYNSEGFQEVDKFGKQYGHDLYLNYQFNLKIYNVNLVEC